MMIIQGKMATIFVSLFWFLSLFVVPSSSSSKGILLPLAHTLTHYTHAPTHHLLRSSSLRSATRHRHHRHHHHHSHHRQNEHHQQQQVSALPLSAGSGYTLTISLGPTTVAELYMDTGSDLVWLPCSPFKCILCEGKSPSPAARFSPSPPPSDSSRVPCSDPSCSAAHSSLPSSDLCSIAGCPLEDIETSSCSSSPCPQFYYAYGDGSLVARLRRGPLSLPASNILSLPNFTFACAHSALAEPVGVAGFGRGLLSIPSQLSAPRFSYCLVAHSFSRPQLLRPSPLILGRADLSSPSSPFVYTPMLHNPKFPYFYSVGLAAVSVGDAMIATGSKLTRVDRNGNGGMVVDSGTTFTMLPSELYSRIAAEFGRRMDRAGFRRAEEAEAETGLMPCYLYPGRNASRTVPTMGLHFAGNASVVLPRGNYFMGFESGGGRRVGCLMVMDAGDEAGEGGPAGTLGNYQQQGFEVVYDLEEGRVGFARRRCAALWDEMMPRG